MSCPGPSAPRALVPRAPGLGLWSFTNLPPQGSGNYADTGGESSKELARQAQLLQEFVAQLQRTAVAQEAAKDVLDRQAIHLLQAAHISVRAATGMTWAGYHIAVALKPGSGERFTPIKEQAEALDALGRKLPPLP